MQEVTSYDRVPVDWEDPRRLASKRVYQEGADFYQGYVIRGTLYCAETSYVRGRSRFGDVKPGRMGMSVPEIWEHVERGPGLVVESTSAESTDCDGASDC